MSKKAFVSDFDGTMTFRDFYHIIIDKYMGEDGRRLYTEWKSTRKINVDFLNIVFSSMHLSQEALIKEILGIPFDESAGGFIEKVRENGWDFYIVSAGTSYYIEILLKHLKIEGINLISMKGVYENGGICIMPDPQSPFYSEIFGVDKGKVIQSLKQKYDQVVFSGDSEPDLSAAKNADLVFARSELAKMMDEEKLSYVPYSAFSDIQAYLAEKGWLK